MLNFRYVLTRSHCTIWILYGWSKQIHRVMELKALHNKQMNCPDCAYGIQKIKTTAVLPLLKHCLPPQKNSRT
ncbi:MAG: hypothetical protein N2235_18880 [Fischerella sp.]|nr:hypothetical protein [Fischerella sp.]